jgi:hypothetical protein
LTPCKLATATCCGDHYARAMASYGVFLAACGFKYHGPKGHIGFAPRLTPEHFRAPFTTAEGWGTFSQERGAKGLRAELEVRWGRLRVRTVTLAGDGRMGRTVAVSVGGKPVEAKLEGEGQRLLVTLGTEAAIRTGERLALIIG